MNKAKYRRLLFLIPLAVMIIIFYFSSQNASASTEVSDGFIKNVSEFIIKILKLENVTAVTVTDTLSFIVRKMAHIFLYAVLGISFHISYYFNIKNNFLVLSFISGLIYSISDEIHQVFVPGRSGKITDVFIDSIGLVLGIFVIYLIIKKVKILQTHHK